MRIVVSLTTIPSRVHHLQEIVTCLKKQTLQVNRIYINLPIWSERENRPYPTPSLNDDSQVKVIRCADHGPITKLYPILDEELDPETLIITVDDDIDYIPERIALLVKWAKNYPDSAIGGSGFIIGNWWNFFGTICQPKNSMRVDVLEGYSGCAYRRKFFKNDIIDYTGAPTEAFYHDDVWISGYLAARNIPRIVHPSNEKNKEGNSGYGSEKHLKKGLSEDIFGFVWKILPVLFYFSRKECFNEKQVVPPTSTFGFWIIVLIVFILLLLIWII
jgi:hypothetical protein